jgi:hypothetical protein
MLRDKMPVQCNKKNVLLLAWQTAAHASADSMNELAEIIAGIHTVVVSALPHRG